MKLKRFTALFLCLMLVISMLPTVSAAGVNGYYNVNYLESYAAQAYHVEGLGATYTPSATTWKVWSPTATHVQVRLYATGSDAESGARVLGTHTMTMDATTGVWSLSLSGDFHNVYYTYLVTVRGVTRETRDIYAKAAGVNGDRSMVVDLDATDPAGWQNDNHVLLDDSTDAVIWEIHVRDFSISPTSGVSEANRGKYLAFTEGNTTLNDDPNEVSTCVSYLKEMGVNTVHLLPVYDFGSVDETVQQDWIETTMTEALSEGYVNGQLNPDYYKPERNWGYDPNNYNVPEGSYSSDPYHGETRIKEFKQMIQALHEAGISVVMDVVYNHTYDLDDLTWGRVLHNNAFNDTVPGYYFRMNSPLSWINGSGCGNVTASDKLMYRKYMVESVHYWAEEYHIDGFRFDLMACHDVDTMNAIRADLDSMYNGEGRKILMYGEPWDGSFGGGTGIADGATEDNASYYGLSDRVAMFNAWMRDAIKGNPDGDNWGWVQGDSTQNSAIYGGLTANDGRHTARSQTVTYADAHDNLILWDKLLKSNGSDAYTDYTSAAAQKYLKQLNLAKTIILMSQGMAFNVGGTEFARTKYGCHNSYKAGDNINAIDWTARKTNAAAADYYKGLIQIRGAFSPITDPINEYEKINLDGCSNSCIAIRIPNTAENVAAGEWESLVLILNDSGYDATVSLPEGEWTILANGIQAGLTSLGTASGSYTVSGYGSAILCSSVNAPSSAESTRIVRDGTEKLYVDLSAVNWWLDAGAVTRAYFYGPNQTNGWAQPTLVDGTIYSYNIPSGDMTHVILVRCNPGYQGSDYWSADCKWNQTGDIALQDEYNFITSFSENNYLVTWDVYKPADTPEPPPATEYYLFGSINGADYGPGANDECLDYKFENGALTASFTDTSYVAVKTSQGDKYMSNGDPGDVASVTLYNTTILSDDMGLLKVPANVEVTFTLVVNGDGTLTLSYTFEGGSGLDPEPSQSPYYMVGSMNDWSENAAYRLTPGTNIGEYVLAGVALAQGMEMKIKNADTNTWYPSGGNYTVSENGIYDVSFYPDGGQAGYVDGCLKLTKVGAYTPDPTVYYLTGTFANWAKEDAYRLNAGENEGEYVLSGVTLSANDGVKIVSSLSEWFPDGENNEYTVPHNGIYDVSFYPAGNHPGYHNGYFLLTRVGGDPIIEGTADNKVILHCWNWSYDTIRENLSSIKAAGYTAVQTSPAQPHSGYREGEIPTGDWWMLYQPLGLHIAKSNESWLGGVSELTALCTAAHELGIEVIVDVVSNHLCNGYNDVALTVDPRDDSQIVANDGKGNYGYQFEVQPDNRVYSFNPELTIDDFRTEYIFCNDNVTRATVWGNIGMPDLKTDTAKVQASVLAYLKELIDAGVDGFRFDAAKHIETPSDGDYASDFWPTVIYGANAYADETRNTSIWAYGEVLSTAGHDRKMNYYAPYIDMTEISYAYSITQGFGDQKGANAIAYQQFKDWLGVGTETLATSDLVLMAESHDMYSDSHGSFSRYDTSVINKAWAVAVARADASALYFARPSGYTQEDGPIGQLGACESYAWKDTEVAAANKFHTAFAGSFESVYAINNFVVVERYDADQSGAVIVNAGGNAASIDFAAQHLANGTYYDQVTGNEFTVSDGHVSGAMGTTGIVVLTTAAPSACEHPADQRYTVTVAATCTEDGYEVVYCHLCGREVEQISYTPALGHIDANADNRCDRCNLYLGTVTVYFVDTLDWVRPADNYTNVSVYAFGTGGQNAEWPGVAGVLVGRTTEDHGIWKAELNPEAYQTVKFSVDEDKSVNLDFASDVTAAANGYVIYSTNGTTAGSDYGAEYNCDIGEDLQAICGHTGYLVVTAAGSEYKVCDCCGKRFGDAQAPEPIYDERLKLDVTMSVGIELATNLSINKAFLNDYQNWYWEIILHEPEDKGGDKVLRYSKTDPNGPVEDKYVWALQFMEISAKKLGVRFEATIHAFDADGKEYVGQTTDVSMRDYVLDVLVDDHSSDVKRTLAADILNYCAAAQVYFSYDAQNPVNQNLTAAQAQALAQYQTDEDPVVEKDNILGEHPTLDCFATLGARLSPSMTTKALNIPEDAAVTIRVTEGEKEIAVLATEKLAPGFYNTTFSEMKANMMRTPYTYTVLVNGEPYAEGDPLVWSFEGYIKAAKDRNDPNLYTYYAVLKYIDSSVAMFPNS